MKTNSFYLKILPFIFIAFIMACGSVSSSTEPPQPEATDTQVQVETQSTNPPEVTATEPGQVTSEPATESATEAPTAASSGGPSCTVLKDLNVRSGPGTAYDPPVDALLANAEVVPIAYNPVGYPGGAWVQVKDLSGKTKGWVSAGAAYVSCNIDLKGLPSVNVAPPPTATPQQSARPSAQTSNPSGTCGSGEQYDCRVVISDGFPVQFVVLKDGQEISVPDGVQFRVDQDNTTIFGPVSDTSPAYCFFGGDGACGFGVLEDNVYKWGYGGPAIEAGTYKVNMDAQVTPEGGGDTVFLHWDGDVTISLP